jgi:hypothetical protein
MTLQAIKEAIEHLPEDERRKLANWFEGMEDAVWDDQIERDFSSGGDGERLLNEVRREAAGGSARPLADGLAERRKSQS